MIFDFQKSIFLQRIFKYFHEELRAHGFAGLILG